VGALVITSLFVAVVVPALAYALIGQVLPGSIPALQYLLATAYLLTAVMTLLEARAAMSSREEPPVCALDDPVELARLPSLTAIVSAYLPNEQRLVIETIVNLATRMKTAPGKLQIILAYNTPEDLPDVEGMLASLADLHIAFTALRVWGSRSKAENINAALPLATGEVTLLLDADHQPAADAAARALRWFEAGYDIVQGRCAIRDWRAGWLSRVVAVEFEEMYSAAHAGRSLAFDTAMFCGTNGWWRTSVLRRIGMSNEMLTEDIDASVRAMLAGYRAIHDRSIVSTELAPPTGGAWWGQRIRWAQGWFQVTLKHQRAIRDSSNLTSDLKLYWTYLLGWRQLFPILSLQIFALLAADVLLARSLHWFDNPYLALTTVLTVVAEPVLVACTYRVTPASRRRELRGAFVAYGAGALLYTTVKNMVAMVATVRELIGQRAWVVTRRHLPVAAALAAVAVPALAAPGARAASDGPNRVPLASVASSMTMTGRAPVADVSVVLPADWTSLSGVLHLGWQASPSVTARSSLRVVIGGSVRAAVPVKAGLGQVSVPIHATAPSGLLQIQLAAQLHTKPCCAPDPGSTAVLALDPARSSLTLTGAWAGGEPLLANMPASLADVLGPTARPLFLALPASPDGADVQAAATVAGAIDRAAGVSVPMWVFLGTPRARLDRLPGDVIDVNPVGAPGVAAARRPSGLITLTLYGKHGGVIDAAAALARTDRGFYPGSQAQVVGSPTLGPPTAPATGAPIAPAGAAGTGPFAVDAVFRLPESRELAGGRARIELELGFDAPAGGRVELALNGLPVEPLNLPASGSRAGQLERTLTVVQDPAQSNIAGNVSAQLVPGNNVLTISGDLPPGQPLAGAGDAEAPMVAVLKGSTVRFASRSRTGQATLGLWPWPFLIRGAATQASFVLPANPNARVLTGTIATIATASLWTATPLDPTILIGPASLPAHGPVVVIAGGTTAPVALPPGAPARPQPNLLETYHSRGRQLLVAFGAHAMTPLASGYEVGRVGGVAIVVAPHGQLTRLVGAPAQQAFPDRPLAWQVPSAILVVAVLAVVLLGIRRARRRLSDLPPPAPGEEPSAPAAQVEIWEQLLAGQGNGTADQSVPRP
jgi:hypothetical protein